MSIQLDHVNFNGKFYSHYYLCNYRPRSVGSDPLSQSLIRFKEHRQIDVEAWTECAQAELSKALKTQTTIIRVFSAEESVTNRATNTALDWLGKSLEDYGLGAYRPELLSKTKTTKRIKQLTKTEREEVLEGIYSYQKTELQHILVLDDILTTGSTMKEIIRSIRQVDPDCTITLFTLAKADYQALLNPSISLAGNSFSWADREWQTIEEPIEYYDLKESLKMRILSDMFSE